ncbi:hypothetical protein POM88_012479 [Heracleum sosnowskyi]|uniref:Molybdopterin oxidoreductase domain-containing protein n=1 Tax=Heracleum sosnowskyi TaxID=360622 RepID=A0AAD8N3H0_9APIA|nr:hypothetical protein POM88_012479 [Heracleum sosnowskyi]
MKTDQGRSADKTQINIMEALDYTNPSLLVNPSAIDVTGQVFSSFGTVLKIAMFDKNGGIQTLVQYVILRDFFLNAYAATCNLVSYGSNNVWCEGNGLNVNADLRSGYILNSGISGLENADVFLLVGTQLSLNKMSNNRALERVVITYVSQSSSTCKQIGYLPVPNARGLFDIEVINADSVIGDCFIYVVIFLVLFAFKDSVILSSLPLDLYQISTFFSQTILSSCSDSGGVWLWDVRSDKIVRTLETKSSVTSTEVSQDGRYITTADGSTVKFWDANQ